MENKESLIFVCKTCRAKNRIPAEKAEQAATCGKCGADLDTRSEAELKYTLRCTACGTKNRVSAGKIDAGAVCGKCRAALATRELSAPQPMMIGDMNFDQQVLKSPIPVLIYAWSPS